MSKGERAALAFLAAYHFAGEAQKREVRLRFTKGIEEAMAAPNPFFALLEKRAKPVEAKP